MYLRALFFLTLLAAYFTQSITILKASDQLNSKVDALEKYCDKLVEEKKTKIRVLFIEDSQEEIVIKISYLERGGFEVYSENVHTEKDLRNALAEKEWDLVISDFTVPNLDGIESLSIFNDMKKSSSIEGTLDIPFILISKNTILPEIAEKVVRLGAKDFIHKSFLDFLNPAVMRELGASKERKDLRALIAQYRGEQEKTNKLLSLLDIIKDAVFTINTDSSIGIWNNGAETLYGWTRQEVLGKKVNELFFGFNMNPTIQVVLSEVEKLGFWIGEQRYISRNGETRILRTQWNQSSVEARGTKTILVVNTDITEDVARMQKEQRLARIESIGVLAGGIAHDFNNVLTGVMGFAELGRDNPELSKQTRDDFRAILTGAKRGADIARKLMTFARGSEGQKSWIDVRLIVSEVFEMIRRSFPRIISIVQEKANDHPLWPIKANPTEMQQILMNLSVNAMHAMPDGGVLTFRLENQDVTKEFAKTAATFEGSPGKYVAISVIDTGQGMSADVMNHLFEPFFTTKPLGVGTGLGLSNVLGIVKSHEGFIKVHSTAGQGSAFSVFIPARSDTPCNTVPIDFEHEARFKAKGQLVLVVDDEETVRTCLSKALRSVGFRVIQVDNGAQGIIEFAEHLYEINAVILDVDMPVLDGRLTLRAMKAIKPSIPVIHISGTEREDLDLTYASNTVQPDDYIEKPYKFEDLLPRLVKLISK